MTTRRDRIRTLLAPAVVLTLVLLGIAVGGRSGDGLAARQVAPKPEVAATLVATVPRRSALWRVERRTAAWVPPDLRAFVAADRVPLRLVWPDGREQSLPVGGAAPVGLDGVQVTDPNGAFAPYLVVGLLPAAFAGASADAVGVTLGGPFLAPTGPRTLEVLRGTLPPGSVAPLDPGDGGAMLLVVSGGVELRTDRGSDMVAAGEAAAVAGPAEVAAAGDPATWLLARVGAAPPATPSPAPTLGEVGVTLYACPAGTDPAAADPARCPRADASAAGLSLVSADGGTVLSLAASQADGERYLWAGLPFGDWDVRADWLAPGFGHWLVPGLAPAADGDATPPAGATPAATPAAAATPGPVAPLAAGDGSAYRVVVGPGAPSLDLPVYLLPDPSAGGGGPESGSIAVTVHACPPGMAPADLDPAACPPGPVADLDLFVLGTGAGRRGPGDAERRGDALVWGDLADGTWVVKVDRFAVGFDRYRVPGGGPLNGPDDAGLTSGPNEGYLVPVSAGAPPAALDLYVFRAPLPATPPAAPTVAGTPAGAGTRPAGGVAVQVRVWQCPPGVAAAADMRALGCRALESRPDGLDLALRGGRLAAADVTPRIADATPVPGGLLPLATLPGGDYTASATLPATAGGYALRSADARATVTLLESRTGYEVDLDPAAPGPDGPVILDLYLLAP